MKLFSPQDELFKCDRAVHQDCAVVDSKITTFRERKMDLTKVLDI